MVNYKQGKIYKIECNITGLVYIGSTCKKKLSGRMTGHRSQYKKYLNRKGKYYSSFRVMENKDYDIILIEDYPCDSKDQLFARERYYTNKIECVNIRKNQGRSLELGLKEHKKEYYKENVDKIRKYYEENSEKILSKCKEYRDENKEKRYEKFTCPCGGKYTHCSRARHFKTKKHLKYLEEQVEE